MSEPAQCAYVVDYLAGWYDDGWVRPLPIRCARAAGWNGAVCTHHYGLPAQTPPEPFKASAESKRGEG